MQMIADIVDEIMEEYDDAEKYAKRPFSSRRSGLRWRGSTLPWPSRSWSMVTSCTARS